MFFDFLGLCLVHYPEWAGMLLNFLVIGSVLYAAVNRARHSYRYTLVTVGYRYTTAAVKLVRLLRSSQEGNAQLQVHTSDSTVHNCSGNAGTSSTQQSTGRGRATGTH